MNNKPCREVSKDMTRYLIRALKFAGRVTAWLAVFKIADILMGPVVNRFCRMLSSMGYPIKS